MAGIAMVAVAAAIVAVTLVVSRSGDEGGVGGTVPMTGTSLVLDTTTTAANGTPSTASTDAGTTTLPPDPGSLSPGAASFLEMCAEDGVTSTDECSCMLDLLLEAGATDPDLEAITAGDDTPEHLQSALTTGIFTCLQDFGENGPGFSTETEALFMDECARAGNRPFCRCALEAYQGVYEENDFLDIFLGSTEPPDDFSLPALGCLYVLPEGSPLPTFVVPNSCTNEQWDFTVNYPTGWDVADDGECRFYRPEPWLPGDDPALAVIEVAVSDIETVEDFIARWGEPVEEWSFQQRTVSVFTTATEGVLQEVFPLWYAIPWGPHVVVTIYGTPPYDREDVLAAARAMILGIDITPYRP
jgi:hypothetical protein